MCIIYIHRQFCVKLSLNEAVSKTAKYTNYQKQKHGMKTRCDFDWFFFTLSLHSPPRIDIEQMTQTTQSYAEIRS